MDSALVKVLHLKHHAVALLWSDSKPENGAMQFQKGKWGCVMWLAAHAAKGKHAFCDKETFGCFGGGVGLGFGNQYLNFPVGIKGFCHFLSVGNIEQEGGEDLANSVRPFMHTESFDNFLHGERYIETPEKVQNFIDSLPITEIPNKYVIFKPLKDVDPEREPPETVIFFANPDQLSALVVLANYGYGDNRNVIIPYAAGCQTIGIYPYQEARSEKPRAVVGLTDLSARVYIRRQLKDKNLMTFSMPWKLFKEMEANVPGSFFERHSWKSLMEE
ncbi:MAG: DUF169 domain-containing protein [Syntrophales bacterium]|jgi:uncharacterized protein (DUF169 family)|nr:DUF169 domain-containing protein [Syntrophales bacterium]MDY0043089.1 DUF169 domain-containing protein [Syntrophales bacterium]